MIIFIYNTFFHASMYPQEPSPLLAAASTAAPATYNPFAQPAHEGMEMEDPEVRIVLSLVSA